MLGLVHVARLGARVLPGLVAGAIARNERAAPVADDGGAQRPLDVVRVVVGQPVDLAAGVEGLHASLVLVDGGEVIKDIPVLGAAAGGAAAEARDAGREAVAGGPAQAVDRVDGLLHDVITRDPREVPPVAHLELHVGPAGLAWLLAEGAAEVVGVDAGDLAELAGVDAVEGGAHPVVVAPAESDEAGEALVARHLGRCQDAAQPRTIHRNRLLRKRVLALLNRVRQMHRPEARISAEQHHIDLTVDHGLVRVKAGEAALGRNLHA